MMLNPAVSLKISINRPNIIIHLGKIWDKWTSKTPKTAVKLPVTSSHWTKRRLRSAWQTWCAWETQRLRKGPWKWARKCKVTPWATWGIKSLKSNSKCKCRRIWPKQKPTLSNIRLRQSQSPTCSDHLVFCFKSNPLLVYLDKPVRVSRWLNLKNSSRVLIRPHYYSNRYRFTNNKSMPNSNSKTSSS